MLCTKCYRPMKTVIQFTKGKAVTFSRCPECWFESKKRPYIFPDTKIIQKKYRQEHEVAPPAKRKGAKKCTVLTSRRSKS